MTTHEIWALVVVGGLVVIVGIAWLFHWYVLSAAWWPLVGRAWRDQRAWNAGTPVLVIPGPKPADWDDLDPDTQAEQLISEWHAPDLERTATWDAIEEPPDGMEPLDRIRWYVGNMDMLERDAKWQADRCWKIAYVEFPRLRAELGIAAA